MAISLTSYESRNSFILHEVDLCSRTVGVWKCYIVSILGNFLMMQQVNLMVVIPIKLTLTWS